MRMGHGRGRSGTAGGGNGHCSQQSQPHKVKLLPKLETNLLNHSSYDPGSNLGGDFF